MFFITISALHVLGGFSTLHQELIKLYVQPWAYCCLPLVWLVWNCSASAEQFQTNLTSGRQQESMTIPKAAHTVL